MAVLHHKEEKIQAVLGRLPKKYSPDDFVTMFIKLYSKDWGKIKSAYIKASQDKEPGTVIHMPKPDLYLKQILETFLAQKSSIEIEIPKVAEPKPVVVKLPIQHATTAKSKASVKEVEIEAPVAKVSKPAIKKVAAKKIIIAEDSVVVTKQKAARPKKLIKP